MTKNNLKVVKSTKQQATDANDKNKDFRRSNEPDYW